MRDYNQITLNTKNGRWISIVQGDGVMGKRGTHCEIYIDGEDEPVGYLTAEKLVEYLVNTIGVE